MNLEGKTALIVGAAANAMFFAAIQKGVLAQIVLMPENHQLV